MSLVVLASCGTGVGVVEIPMLTSEFEIESAPANLAAAVTVDSVFWLPLTFSIANEGELDIDGDYRIAFRNTTDRALELRYDLRFLDEDGFLIDNFIPFGLPAAFTAGEARTEVGTFTIRSGEIRSIYDVVTMRIVAQVSMLAEVDDP